MSAGKAKGTQRVAGRVYFRIADISISLLAEDPEIGFQGNGARSKFLRSQDTPDAMICARWATLSPVPTGDMLFDASGPWQLYRTGEGSLLFRFTSPAFGSRPYKLARFSPDFTSGEVCLHRPFFASCLPADPLEYPLDELLIMCLLAQGRGVEVHACGVVLPEGDGILFVGQSGAGKTTMARLWKGEDGVQILSDDRVILRQQGGRITMHGTPWHGEAGFASPGKARVSRICFLRHGQDVMLPVRSGEAAARIFACSFVPFYDGQGLGFTMAFLEHVVRSVPCYELAFSPHKGLVRFVKEMKF